MSLRPIVQKQRLKIVCQETVREKGITEQLEKVPPVEVQSEVLAVRKEDKLQVSG